MSSPTTVPPQQEEGDGMACVVCMERPPSTSVLPCLHHVACGRCSRELEHTPHARICIICRQPITEVLYGAG